MPGPKKTDVSALYPNAQVASRVTAYSAAHSTPLPAHIAEYHARVVRTDEKAFYMISDFQAQSHIWLARLIGAKRVLEIGVYVGYSSLVWAHAVGPEGKVTGLEFNPEYAERAREAYASYGVTNVEVIVGDGLETLPTLNPPEPYDLIFIDAQKSGYPIYLREILSHSKPGQPNRLLRPGGLIVADNVLRRGIVADDSDANPWVEREGAERSEYWRASDVDDLRDYNDLVRGEEGRLDVWLVPLFDGVSVARLVD